MQGHSQKDLCVMPPVGQPFSLFDRPDHKILEDIYTTHVHADETFDDDSLFAIVESILKSSIQIVDNIVQAPMCMHEENIAEKIPKANFNVPLCVLKGISCEMQCKAPGDQIAHDTTLAILKKLSGYSWEAKAVLALAAFSIEFGDFCLLTQFKESDHLAKSIAMLKGVQVLLKPSDREMHLSMIQLNNLVKETLQVIDILDQLDKLSRDDLKDIPELSTVMKNIPVDVYWAIISIVACAAKVNALTCDECKEYDLALYLDRICNIRKKLNNHLVTCKEQHEVALTYRKICKILQTPTEIMEVLKALIFTKDSSQQLIDCSTKETVVQVEIEVLRRNNVLLYFSSLEITENDISILNPIHEDTQKRNDKHKIIWIPIVDQWTDTRREQFKNLRTTMSWYTVEFSASRASVKYIKEQWNYTGKPTMVVLNPQGTVVHHDALRMIRKWGVEGFPYTKEKEDELSNSIGDKWLPSVVQKIESVSDWIKEERVIIFCGGKDKEWIDEFKERVNTLSCHSFLQQKKIQLQVAVCQRKGNEGEDDILGSFWSEIESLHLTKINKEVDTVTHQIQTLLSYKEEKGWFMLSKGSSVVVTGHGVSVEKVVMDFEKWKEYVIKENPFEICFKNYYEQVCKEELGPCCRLEIPWSNVKLPEVMKCSSCERSMEIVISYKCCHGANAYHH